MGKNELTTNKAVVFHKDDLTRKGFLCDVLDENFLDGTYISKNCGLIDIMKNGKYKRVLPSLLDSFISDGWINVIFVYTNRVS